KERLGMALEKICEQTQPSRRAGDLLERTPQLLTEHRVRFDELTRIVQRAASADERLIELGDRLAEVVADPLKGHLIQLLDDLCNVRFHCLNLTGNRGELHGILRPIERRRYRIGHKVKLYVERPGQEVPASKLRTQSP